jgi:hypothetical protein
MERPRKNGAFSWLLELVILRTSIRFLKFRPKFCLFLPKLCQFLFEITQAIITSQKVTNFS